MKDELDRLKNEVANLKETNETCASLKSQLEEVKAQLLEQNKVSQAKVFEIVSLKVEMNKIAATYLKFKRSPSTLDDILSYQRSPHVRNGLGYDEEEITKGFKLSENKPRSYAGILRVLSMVKKARKKILKLSKTRRLLQNKEDPVNLISQEEDHLFLGMKKCSLVIVTLAMNLDIGL